MRLRDFRLLLACALLAFAPCCVRRQRGVTGTGYAAVKAVPAGAPVLDLNAAREGELEKLPGIGKGLAARIVEHRERYGRFQRPEHLMMVRGISDRRFRALRALVRVE